MAHPGSCHQQGCDLGAGLAGKQGHISANISIFGAPLCCSCGDRGCFTPWVRTDCEVMMGHLPACSWDADWHKNTARSAAVLHCTNDQLQHIMGCIHCSCQQVQFPLQTVTIAYLCQVLITVLYVKQVFLTSQTRRGKKKSTKPAVMHPGLRCDAGPKECTAMAGPPQPARLRAQNTPTGVEIPKVSLAERVPRHGAAPSPGWARRPTSLCCHQLLAILSNGRS